jgi:(p)ppGpp synthase/HD superfamily hydrolase
MNAGERDEFERAAAMAIAAHQGQVYRAGDPKYRDEPYILHLFRVVEGVESASEKVVAVLHDILEDTEVKELPTFVGLYERSAVILLTRKDGETYEEYIRSIASARGLEGRLARAVKIADLKSNMSRMPATAEKFKKYHKAVHLLHEAVAFWNANHGATATPWDRGTVEYDVAWNAVNDAVAAALDKARDLPFAGWDGAAKAGAEAGIAALRKKS